MQQITTNFGAFPSIAGRVAVEGRATQLFCEHQQNIYKHTDHMFAILMTVQWLGGVTAAFWLSPRTWIGSQSEIHLHIWAALVWGGAISIFPVTLALIRPGKASTRFTIAAGQMLMGALLIHLTGGRIETHFHIFGSLAFLAVYKDWRVLVPATLIVAADHFLRGVFFPQSIFGVLTAGNWRWLEHAGWVIFTDIFLVISCLRGKSEMWHIAERTAQLETSEESYRELFENAQEIIAERKRAEVELSRLASIVESSDDAIMSQSLATIILSWNGGAQRLYGYTAEEVRGHSTSFLVPPDHAHDEPQILERIRQGERVENYETVRVSKDGKRINVSLTVSAVRDAKGGIVAVSQIARDITDRKRAEVQLLHLALHDGLTGLPNRALFLDHLKLAAERAKRREGQIFAVLFLDLDRFKVINDSLGHAVGDKLLVEIAARLLRCVRLSDTVARLGGDEFTILLEDTNSEQAARLVAERIQAELTLPFDIDGTEVFTSASIGIRLSATGLSPDLPQDLLRDADAAMYQAKHTGKARAEVFDEAMHRNALELMQLETELRRAIEREEFCLYYQPIVALESCQLIGFEALVRWQHPQRGLLSPATFIPIAEETGLILPIGEWVMREAARQMREWQGQYQRTPPLTISVNVPSIQFVQPGLVEQITKVLDESGLAASSLKLEITETVMMENYDMALKTLKGLRELGVELSMDDFGTGYSSLSYLQRFPVGTLKIDRTFINDMGEDGASAEIVRTIIMLAQNLRIKVVAEGVETSWQHERLKTLGCEYGQGYLYSRAMRVEQAEGMLAKQADAATRP